MVKVQQDLNLSESSSENEEMKANKKRTHKSTTPTTDVAKSPSEKSPPVKTSKTADAGDKTPVSSRRGEMEELKLQLAESLKLNAELSKQVAQMTQQISELLSRADRSDQQRDEALEGAVNYWKVASGSKAARLPVKKNNSAPSAAVPTANSFDGLPVEPTATTGAKERVPPIDICARSITQRGLVELLKGSFKSEEFKIAAPRRIFAKLCVVAADAKTYNDAVKQLLEKKVEFQRHDATRRMFLEVGQKSAAVKEVIGEENLKYLEPNGGKIGVRATTTESYKRMIELLAAKKVIFHAYPLKSDAPAKFMLSGLTGYTDSDEDLEEIRAELNASHPVKCERVRKHVTPATKRQGMDAGQFVCSFPSGTKLEEVKRNYVGHLRVYFDILKKTPGQIMCHRCQGDHPTLRCHRLPRCVKCGEGHLSADCALPKDGQVKCCHCGGNHTANFLGCPVLKANRKKAEDRKNENKQKASGNHKVWNLQEARDRFQEQQPQQGQQQLVPFRPPRQQEHTRQQQQPRRQTRQQPQQQQQQQSNNNDDAPKWARELIQKVSQMEEEMKALKAKVEEELFDYNYEDIEFGDL